jgi:prepilin-type N-terminal cleavage/methylation domain-containing protein
MSRRRPGFTLIEIMVVLAILVILGALLIPTLAGLKGNSGVKAGADTVRARLFDARARAMEDGILYRVSLSDDGKTIQIAPDDPNQTSDSQGRPINPSQEKLPDGVFCKVVAQDGVEATVDQTGWVRIVTFTAEGTCREDVAEVIVNEDGKNVTSVPITIHIRGVTGAVRTLKSGAKK